MASFDHVRVGEIDIRSHGTSVPQLDINIEEGNLNTDKHRPLAFLYCFERYQDKLMFHSSHINIQIQSILRDIIIDEYGSNFRL